MLPHDLYNEGHTMRGSHGLEELLVLRAEALEAAIIRQRCQHLGGGAGVRDLPGQRCVLVQQG